MSTKVAHTQTPWAIEDIGHTKEITANIGEGCQYVLGYIAFTGDGFLKAANESCLLTAVNHHKELVTRLYNLVNIIEGLREPLPGKSHSEIVLRLSEARETLKKLIP